MLAAVSHQRHYHYDIVIVKSWFLDIKSPKLWFYTFSINRLRQDVEFMYVLCLGGGYRQSFLGEFLHFFNS